MRRFLFGTAVGGLATYAGINYFSSKSHQNLTLSDHQTVSAYLSRHKLQTLLKQSIMNGYMQLNKAFLDYGLKVKLDGFQFYNTYFEREEMENNHITKMRCIFSPNQQLCGHPDIQHGGATATIADQNSGMLAMLFSKKLVATGELEVKYKKPVKRGQIYVWEGEIEKRQERKIYVNSTIKSLETGEVYAEVKTLMVTVEWEHRMGQVFHLLFDSDSVPEKQ